MIRNAYSFVAIVCKLHRTSVKCSHFAKLVYKMSVEDFKQFNFIDLHFVYLLLIIALLNTRYEHFYTYMY